MYTRLAIGSGSIRGIMYVGALRYLIEEKLIRNIDSYSGCSVGAIVCLLCILEYTIDEIERIVYSVKKDDITNISIKNLLEGYGLDNGNKIKMLIKRFISTKGHSDDITMKELYDVTKKDFYILSVNVSDSIEVYFNHKTHPDLPVYQAIRMSTNIPLIWEKVEYEGSYYIDGAFCTSFPMYPFNIERPNEKTILLIINSNIHCRLNVFSILDYISSIFIYKSRTVYKNDKEAYTTNDNVHVIELNNTTNVSVNEFNLSKKTKKVLIDMGYVDTKKFFSKS